MSKTRVGVSNGRPAVEAEFVGGLKLCRRCALVEFGGRECASKGFEQFLRMRLHVHERWRSDH